MSSYIYCTPYCAWKLLDLHKSNQGNTTNLNISFSISMENEKELLEWDLNPRHTAYEAAQLAGPDQGNTRQGQPV